MPESEPTRHAKSLNGFAGSNKVPHPWNIENVGKDKFGHSKISDDYWLCDASLNQSRSVFLKKGDSITSAISQIESFENLEGEFG